ncbi:MAG: GMC family oxidoreductase, partial [Phaeodactylibacter sp.]|nr:GMC family oxidoreductase [Phaeodactylibacter sp.]
NHKGRIQCQYRNRCSRGCPYGAYFSSQASTLPAAVATGNMTLRPHSIVHTIIFDDATQKATGVRILDAETNETIEYFAKIIFCNASALGTTQILLNSTSERFPNGLGNDSDALGRYLMDHHFRVGASGTMEGFDDKYYKCRRPGGFYIPRFRNVDEASKMENFVRGYGYQGGASRKNWSRSVKELQFGGEFKDALMYPGEWRVGMTAFGECLPYEDNRVVLNKEVTDKFGQPTLTIDCEFKENEMKMRVDMKDAAVEILEKCGLKDIDTFDDIGGPGLGIHEMGTARMGRDPKTSVLNAHNQIHAVPNVFVTDGACMTSAGCQNPSLTYMALTARAADYAVSELKNGNL